MDQLGYLLLVIFFSTTVRAAIGFGNALIAMPLLTWVLGATVTSPLIALVAFVIACFLLFQDHQSVNIKGALAFTIPSIVGIPLGTLFLKNAYEGFFKLSLGLIILIIAVLNLGSLRIKPFKSSLAAYLLGFVSGFISGAFNTNGPIIVIYGAIMQWEPKVFRATVQGYFWVTGIITLTSHALAGLWTAEIGKLFLICIPATLIGIYFGTLIHRRIPVHLFQRIIWYALAIIGFSMIVEVLFSWWCN